MPSPFDIDGCVVIGVHCHTATLATKDALAYAVALVSVAAFTASLAGVLGQYFYQGSAVPVQLVLQLSAEFAPSLVKDGFIQSGLLFDVSAWFIGCSCC